MWAPLLLLLGAHCCLAAHGQCHGAADLSLLQLRASSPACGKGEGRLLHGLVKKGHGVDWTDPQQVDLELSDDDRRKYDQVMGSLRGGWDPRVFLLFFGYARSGHSMIGSILDAHPKAAVANEFDAIKAYQSGDSRERLLTNLVAVSTAYNLVGRCQAGYHYEIPGVVAQPFAPGMLRVIGDKDGGCNARKQLNVSELVKFRQYVGPTSRSYMLCAIRSTLSQPVLLRTAQNTQASNNDIICNTMLATIPILRKIRPL
jgi:hypothetical protein